MNNKTTIKIGDLYEYCTQEPGEPSVVHYGRVISINDNGTFNFEKCHNTIRKGKFVAVLTEIIHKNVTAIRGVGEIHENTWDIKE